jgi:alpha-beta hydrolase superfamily lysophospholipase
MRTDFHVLGAGDHVIACSKWGGKAPPKAVVHIVHGMGEHVGRYDHLGEVMASHDIVVIGHDQRGHGRTALMFGELGDFGQDGFPSLVADLHLVLKATRSTYRDVPILLLGHSMGSFVVQQYLIDRAGEGLTGGVLSGSGTLDTLMEALIVSALPIGGFFNAAFEPARTPFDWLTRDASQIDAFLRDPLCFAQLSDPSMASFMAAAAGLSDAANLSRIRSGLPILLLSGGCDPIGQQTAGTTLLAGRLERAGVQSIEKQVYPGARHEVLNEINRDQVVTDLLTWIARVTGR